MLCASSGTAQARASWTVCSVITMPTAQAGTPTRPETRSHLVSHLSARQAFEKCRGAKGIRTPDLLHAMQTRYQLRHSPSCAPLERSLVEEAGPAPQTHSLAPAPLRLGPDLVVHRPAHALRLVILGWLDAQVRRSVRTDFLDRHQVDGVSVILRMRELATSISPRWPTGASGG